MCETLFRGKRLDNGKWVEGYLFTTVNHSYIAYAGQYDDDLFISPQNIFIEVDPTTVGQYTELKDKNYKRIFEGDIVESEYGIEKVKFWGGGFWPFAIPGWECTPDPEKSEIIGNIYDNPELLKAILNS